MEFQWLFIVAFSAIFELETIKSWESPQISTQLSLLLPNLLKFS
jgi:hypothetical protein